MKKGQMILIEIIIGIILIGGCVFTIAKALKGKKQTATIGVTVVPTMQDTLTADSSWCATFQLVWNDMKNEVVKRDIVFNPQEKFAENLNKEEFTENMLSSEYYYKAYGLKTLALKEQIEKGIKEKFNQKSDILDKFDWSEDALDNPNNPEVNRYFFYTMLYREFEFLQKFDKLKNDKFGSFKDIKYFGIDDTTDNSVGNQIEVLFYNSSNDFAILINTKNNDEVIFYKNPEGNNFKEIYDNMLKNSRIYTGSKKFASVDEFKAPYLSFNVLREYTELENKKFITIDGEGEILKAIQTIKFTLDEKGGKIKSEAGMDMNYTSSAPIKPDEPRYFYVDDTFAIFLREKGKEMPYFAGKIEDITKFQ